MDPLCFTTSVLPRASSNAFAKNFFFRTHTKWNHIPLVGGGVQQQKRQRTFCDFAGGMIFFVLFCSFIKDICSFIKDI